MYDKKNSEKLFSGFEHVIKRMISRYYTGLKCSLVWVYDKTSLLAKLYGTTYWVMESVFGMCLIVCLYFYVLGLNLILWYKRLSSHLNM